MTKFRITFNGDEYRVEYRDLFWWLDVGGAFPYVPWRFNTLKEAQEWIDDTQKKNAPFLPVEGGES